MSRQVSQQRGFTLLELVAVVAVSVVLAAMGMPMVKDYQQTYTATGVQQQLAETLANARERAVSVGESVFVCASSDGTTCSADAWTKGWLVYQSSQRKMPGDDVPAAEIIEHVTNTQDKYKLSVMDESFASVNDIRFDARGFNAAQQRVTALMCNPGVTAEMDAVLVERTGRVRVEKNTLNNSAAPSQKIQNSFDCNQA